MGHDADRMKDLHKFVHLCFRNNHPMEYKAREEGRIAQSIFLQVHADVLKFVVLSIQPETVVGYAYSGFGGPPEGRAYR